MTAYDKIWLRLMMHQALAHNGEPGTAAPELAKRLHRLDTCGDASAGAVLDAAVARGLELLVTEPSRAARTWDRVPTVVT